ncbi:hypothetical protein JD844_025124 [Phrynosoma platyrhinos]|uniref:Calpain catalytic domain-containing protein n=1 Tax=Phrynosoma platyrhinos TaxID=52577 RepID=A0ABQ7SZ81_PHRPL|nr:hypothetical protein JD844_025124 [Phrynosoma platyrhinos]
MPFLQLPRWHQWRKTPWKPKALGRKGTFQKPSSLGQQNYRTLLENCLKKKCLFEDEFFPADVKSIGTGPLLQKLPEKIQWKRPYELCNTPVFFSANKRRVLCQGLLEDCWFLAAVEAITFHQDILFRIVPQNQSFEKKKYAGIFHFKFWHFGEWVDVVVDDRLPVNEAGQLVFLSSVYKNLFWGALLEKAYAKLCGSYEDLQTGQVSEALVDFTGGINITIKLAEAPPDLWETLTRATYSSSLMGCQTLPGPIKVLENGLVASHAYTVTGIRKVTCKHGPENLVRLRNPWGKMEWKGDWSDNSGKWELLNPKEKILLRRNFEDGEFWMSLQDFQTHFVDLMICKLTPDLMSQVDGKKWMCSTQCGKWVKGSTAGGRMSAHKGTFCMNPQYLLKVLQGNGSKRSFYSCSVMISLIQKHNNKHRNRMPHLHIGLSVYKLGQERYVHCSYLYIFEASNECKLSYFGFSLSLLISFSQYYDSNRRLPSTFFAWNRPLNWSLFQNEREVTQEFQLPPGIYVIVPSTSEPHQESEFLLRVFSRKHTLHELGGDSSCVLSKEIVDKHEDWEDFFAKYFVKDIFKKRDIHQTGTLEQAELHAAVQEMGISLSNELCKLLAFRYGDSNLKITFESFAYFVLRVELMIDAFHNMSKDGKGIYLQKSEWMTMTLYS